MLVAVVSNLDNLTIGFAFGMRGQRVGGAPNLVIAAITMAATAGAMSSGRAVATLLPPASGSVAGGSIIVAIGAATAIVSVTALRRPVTDPSAGVVLLERVLGGRAALSCRDAVPIGVALSLNNIGTGVGAGVAGVSALATTLLAGALSLIFVGGGSRVGWSISRRVGRRAPLIAGIVLIGLGAATLSGAV